MSIGLKIVPVTLSLDTNIYASGDVLADTQEIANCMRSLGGRAIVKSIVVNDKDDQGQALDIVFLKTNVSLGTENAAVSISDTNADQMLGFISIGTDDFIDIGGCRVATRRALDLIVESAAGSSSLFVGAISRGTGTYTASGITLLIGFSAQDL